MKIKTFALVAMIIANALLGSEAVFPRIKNAPVVDGNFTVVEYQGGEHRILKKRGGGEAVNATEIYFGISQGKLYAAFICWEKDVKSMVRAFRTPEERGNPAIWSDDCVELRFDPWNAVDDTFVQRAILFNSNGIVYDAAGGDSKVDFSIHVQCSVLADRWVAELFVPLTDLLPYTSNGNELWRIAVIRNNPRLKEVSTFSGSSIRSLAARENNLVFRSGAVNAAKPITLAGLSTSKLELRNENPAVAIQGKLELLNAAGEVLSAVQYQLDQSRPVVAINLPRKAAMSRYRLSAGRDLVWEWAVPLPRPRNALVKITEKPLYQELFSDQPLNLGVVGTPCRPHGLMEDMLAKALELGIPWERETALKLFFYNKLIPCGSTRFFAPEWNDFPAYAPKGMKYVGMADAFYPPHNEIVPRVPGKPRTIRLDPYSEKYILEHITKNYLPYAEHIFAIRAGDEITEWSVEQFIEMSQIHKGKGTYPWLDQTCEVIKNKYGHGKFGPPESASDNNPYRWIALRSFVHDEIINQQKRLKKFVNEKMPGVKLIGDSSMSAQSRVYDYEDFTDEVCDIAVIQLYPANNPAISDFSFNAKQLRDIMQVQELFPCFHVCNYGAKYTPLETLEKISQGFRGGATGIMWYLADTRGEREHRSPGMEYYGAPERFQTMMAISKELENMKQLRFPEPDCGVLLSVTTARGYIGNKERPQKNQMMHSLLEVQGGAWDRFFNETSLKRNRVDLGKFKAVFVSDAKFSDEATIDYLVDYVKKGGVLVITDPEAFCFNSAAQPLPRTMFPGLSNSVLRTTQKFVRFGHQSLELQRTPAWELCPAESSKVLMTYADGKPAALSTPLDKGKVIVFGVNFAQRELVCDPVWQKWSRSFFKELQLKLDQDIWRFRFPVSLIQPPPPPPSGKCLTNNHLYFRNFQAIHDRNVAAHAEASYCCNPAPDAPADAAKVSMRDSRLTDRRMAYRMGNAIGLAKNPINKRIIGWSTPDKLTIEFDLVHKVDFKRAVIFYQGVMRDIDIYTSADGKSYQKQASFAASAVDTVRVGVRQKNLELEKSVSDTRFIKFKFAAAQDKATILPPGKLPLRVNLIPPLRSVPFSKANFQIAEIELWSDK